MTFYQLGFISDNFWTFCSRNRYFTQFPPCLCNSAWPAEFIHFHFNFYWCRKNPKTFKLEKHSETADLCQGHTLTSFGIPDPDLDPIPVSGWCPKYHCRSILKVCSKSVKVFWVILLIDKQTDKPTPMIAICPWQSKYFTLTEHSNRTHDISLKFGIFVIKPSVVSNFAPWMRLVTNSANKTKH